MKSALLFVLTICLVSAISAQSPNPSASPPPPACTAPEFRQFDFWLGNWKVLNPQTGQRSGTSEITRASEGCAIREQWRAARGTTGMSVNYYDAADGEWHEDWVGGDGTILHLHGKFSGNAMVMTSESKTGKVLTRMTWTPLDGGKVKQESSNSSDNGQTWQITFVGIYEKQS
jgi:hypothetical protein